ncbi:M35 family metallo-endopeptidase [Herbaspirillum sp. SJZ107]|uniref:M35 family metallo-endopeptidase n=1 Tax=Herbaspirillum sp. SJZ107 TaxID=2572881 RepID=UPI00116F4D19|nr:M35 family metallo-endopeptidase [Herbaspirillum sp. SJZ107]TQK07497.1 extracellular peptidase [Herbaspirillum sp. SJZ107]
MVGKQMAAAALAAVAALASMAEAAPAAPAAPAAGGVRVTVTPERTSLGKSDEVAVVVTITNTSGATAYLLKWQTPFGAVEAPLFEVTRDGQPVPYLGRMVKRAPPAPDDYIALAPGASRSVRVELSALYRMDVTGAYSIRYRDGVLQLFGKPSSSYAPAHALAEPALPAASVYIAGRLPRGMAAPEPLPQGGAALGFSQCSNPQQQSVTEAFKAAQTMAQDAGAYLQGTQGPRYSGWFGAVDAARTATVARHFTAIGEAFAGKPVTVDCGCREDYYAYVYPNQPYKIHVCNAFWSAPMTGTDSKGGTLVHEMSHFTVVAGTGDWAYGHEAAAALAAGNPERAIDNADSHEYFGENTPHQDLR